MSSQSGIEIQFHLSAPSVARSGARVARSLDRGANDPSRSHARVEGQHGRLAEARRRSRRQPMEEPALAAQRLVEPPEVRRHTRWIAAFDVLDQGSHRLDVPVGPPPRETCILVADCRLQPADRLRRDLREPPENDARRRWIAFHGWRWPGALMLRTCARDHQQRADRDADHREARTHDDRPVPLGPRDWRQRVNSRTTLALPYRAVSVIPRFPGERLTVSRGAVPAATSNRTGARKRGSPCGTRRSSSTPSHCDGWRRTNVRCASSWSARGWQMRA